MAEEWRPAPAWEGLYEVSSHGRVRNARTGRLLAPSVGTCGYAEISLHRSRKAGGDGKSHRIKLHRLVALAFVPNPMNKREVNHIDTVRTNARADNLEWMDKYENHAHSASLGKYRAETNPNRVKKLSAEIIEDCRQRRASGESISALAAKYNVAGTSMYRALYGRPPQNKAESTRQTWNWRAELTDEEIEVIVAYDRAMDVVKQAQREADKHRLEFTRVQNRALQRAKYRALRTQSAEQPQRIQKAGAQ